MNTNKLGTNGSSPVYSVVAPFYNEEETIDTFYERITAVMERLGESYELVLVDDGSTDGTAERLWELNSHDCRVCVVSFSRNFGHQAAITAGLDYARGQAVVIIDSDLQDPPEVIPELTARWKQGAEVVYARRQKRKGETVFKLLTASAFYRLMAAITDVDIPRDAGDFRLLDRKVVDVLRGMREHHRFMRGLSAWAGFRQEEVLYDRHERFAGRSKYPLGKMFGLATDAVISFSHLPLHLVTGAGLIATALGLTGGALNLVKRAEGARASRSRAAILLLGGVHLLGLGVWGEYLSRIYDEVRGRPLYVTREVLPARNQPQVRLWDRVVQLDGSQGDPDSYPTLSRS